MGNKTAHPAVTDAKPPTPNSDQKEEFLMVNAGSEGRPVMKVKCTANQGINLKLATEFVPFKEWLDKFNTKEMKLETIHFQSMDMFGKKVGFLKFVAFVKKDDKQLPGIVFMRGPAVAILTILIDPDGKEFVVCTNQARVPVGDYLLEVPAGMIDESGNFKGQVALEMKEETGIEINDKNLKDLTELAYGTRYPGIMPSPGGCDEYLKLFVYRDHVPREKNS